jgi:hypothetical protein
MSLIIDTLSNKLCLLLTGLFAFVTSLIIALSLNWRLALVLICMPITMIVVMGTLGSYMNKMQQKTASEYAKSANFAEDVFSCARSVMADGAQRRLEKRYEKILIPAMMADLRSKGAMAMMVAIVMMVILWGYGLAVSEPPLFLADGGLTRRMTVLARRPILTERRCHLTRNCDGFVDMYDGWCGFGPICTICCLSHASKGNLRRNLCHYRASIVYWSSSNIWRDSRIFHWGY